ncbi:MAG: hypothetical protein KKC80_05990 [Candidatus Margulisbacteria bacterium]|nr:hypothetical protein [Candidatus Margulisiibacteriota bacterium]
MNNYKCSWKVLTLIIGFFSLAMVVSASAPVDKTCLTEKRTVYTGIFREGAPRNMNYIKQYEKQVGKKPGMIMWYQDWEQAFPKEDCQKVAEYGAIPHIVWEPWYWGDHNKVSLKDIIGGKWDDYIRDWAKGVKEFDQPIMLRIAHEFNIDGYPWGVINNEKNPETYTKAYRHIVDIFKREKADKAKFIWCFMNYSYPNESWNDWEKAYPGDKYVDWIGIDGYNWGTTQSWSEWQVFKYLFREQARKSRMLWPDKPIMVAEFGSAEQGGNKAAWIREIPKYLATSMRDIDAIIWFDLKKETDWRIGSTPQALAAYRDIMKDPIFASSAAGLANLTISSEKSVRRVAFAPQAKCPLTIDGNLNDWDKTYPIVMKDASFFKEGLDWGGPEDLSGSIFLMWDDQNLYLAAEVTDRQPLVNKRVNQDVWNGDAIEMVLGTESADPKRNSFGKGDYQFGLSSGDGKTTKPQIWNWQRRRSPRGGEISVSKASKLNGYVLEAKIPLDFFTNGFKPAAGRKVDFDIALDDADSSGQREKQLIWNGDFYFYKDPSVWGILEFK